MVQVPQALQAAFTNRYLIERELGRGGYSVVYLAHDTKHDRKVALKVLQPELALAVRHERFLREIQIAAKLTHPHILPLYDSGEAAGAVYYVMPYVEGESLRDRLIREKQLPVDDALAITRDVAVALTYAHAQGVVHRDIKPENILLSHGEALVADFGIARALTVAGGQTVTEAGIAVGTPAYMSPEQGAGSGEPDARSDIYSLGCVLYEMLAGHPPFVGTTAQEVLSRHALDPVPSLRAARGAVPEMVERAINTALAKQSADRFPTASQFAASLTTGARPPGSPFGLVRAATIAVVLIVVATFGRRWVWPEAAQQSVGVLAFTSLSADQEDQYLADGIAEELISGLSRIQGLKVPASTSSFVFKRKDISEHEIARKLGVRTILSGSLRRSGGRLRVSARLTNAADGFQLWSETYDREPQDVIAVQEDIARAIVAALRVELAGPESLPIVREYTQDRQAQELYQQGRYHWNQRTPEAFPKSVRAFEAAIARDPSYALAYSGLSDAHYVGGQLGYEPQQEARTREKDAAVRAVELDDQLAEGHTSLAVALRFEGDLDGAEDHFRRAIALNAGYAWAHTMYAQLLANRERYQEAVAEAEIAQGLDPLSASVNPAGVFLQARRYDKALAAIRKAMDVELHPQAYLSLGRIQLELGSVDSAIVSLRKGIDLGGRSPALLGQLGRAYAMQGRRAEAMAILAQLEERGKTTNTWGPIATVYVGLGDKARAIDALERSFATNRASLLGLGGNPTWDMLRSDARFQALKQKVDSVP